MGSAQSGGIAPLIQIGTPLSPRVYHYRQRGQRVEGSAVREGGFVDIRCLSHIIYLLVRDALGLGDRASVSHSAVQEVIDGRRKMAGYINGRVKGNKVLRDQWAYAGFFQHCLLQ